MNNYYVAAFEEFNKILSQSLRIKELYPDLVFLSKNKHSNNGFYACITRQLEKELGHQV